MVLAACGAGPDHELTDGLGIHPFDGLADTDILELRVVDQTQLRPCLQLFLDFYGGDVLALQLVVFQIDLWMHLPDDVLEALSQAVMRLGGCMGEVQCHFHFEQLLLFPVCFRP